MKLVTKYQISSINNATKNEHICSMYIKINKVGKQEVGIWWVYKRYPQYGIPIWSLWPNIRFLPSTVAEKNASKNILDGRKDRQTDRGKTVYPLPLRGAGVPSIVAEKNATKNEHICSMCLKINKVGKQEVGIWRVQKRYPQYGIPIWSLWPNIRFLPSTVTEKNAMKNILDGRKDDRRREVKQYIPPPPSGSGGIITWKYLKVMSSDEISPNQENCKRGR
jgi:hypothetical protein